MQREKKKELIRITKFVLFSISAGVIQMGSFTILNEVCKIPYYWVSYLISLILSVVWNFTFNRKFTFKSASNVPVAMIKVACYYAVFAPLSTLLERYLTGIGWNEYLVTFINMLINVTTEFVYQRYFVFIKSIDTNQQKTAETTNEPDKTKVTVTVTVEKEKTTTQVETETKNN